MAQRILIFRRGSLGDGVISLPALRFLAERHPGAERRILTNSPVTGRAQPIQSVLAPTGLVDGFFTLPAGTRDMGALWRLGRAIAAWGPRLLVYLSEPSSRPALMREMLFFSLCGIRRFVGLPFGMRRRRYRRLGERLWESEGARLLRCIGADAAAAPAGDALTVEELAEAEARLAGWPGAGDFVAFSVGAKQDDKDWGDDNWRAVLAPLSKVRDGLGLVTVGAEDEAARSQALAAHWRGDVLDLCGVTAPRVSAAVMGRARFYLGHDSGPMHLAALAGTRCVAVFGARAKPGVWFPAGDGHRVFYPWEHADNAPETAGLGWTGFSIGTIDSADVLAACGELLDEPVEGAGR